MLYIYQTYYIGCIYVLPYLCSFVVNGFTSHSSEIATQGCPWGCLEMFRVVEILSHFNQHERKEEQLGCSFAEVRTEPPHQLPLIPTAGGDGRAGTCVHTVGHRSGWGSLCSPTGLARMSL